MLSGSLARRYARALMLIGEEDGSYERVGRDLRSLASAMEASEELTSTLTNPVFPREDREKILRALMQQIGASQAVVNTVRLLLDRERLAAVPDIARELEAMIDAKAGRVKAEVVSAQPLTDAQKQQLIGTLESLSGKTVQVQTSEDPDLLGGVVAKVGDMVYDGSLRTQLRQLRETLLH